MSSTQTDLDLSKPHFTVKVVQVLPSPDGDYNDGMNTIYEQKVDKLNLLAVIEAVNSFQKTVPFSVTKELRGTTTPGCDIIGLRRVTVLNLMSLLDNLDDHLDHGDYQENTIQYALHKEALKMIEDLKVLVGK